MGEQGRWVVDRRGAPRYEELGDGIGYGSHWFPHHALGDESRVRDDAHAALVALIERDTARPEPADEDWIDQFTIPASDAFDLVKAGRTVEFMYDDGSWLPHPSHDLDLFAEQAGSFPFRVVARVVERQQPETQEVRADEIKPGMTLADGRRVQTVRLNGVHGGYSVEWFGDGGVSINCANPDALVSVLAEGTEEP